MAYTCDCGQAFRSVSAFDTHRIGRFEKPGKPSTRRCMTPEEMEKRGMTFVRGVWTTGGHYPARKVIARRKTNIFEVA